MDTLHGWLALAKLLRIIFSGEDSRVVYYGMVDDGGGFMRGKTAGIPSTISAGPTGTDTWGWDFDGSYGDWYGGHEIGHTRGRYHAEFCGATGGLPYPYTGGRISPSLTGNTAIYGFDITTHAIYPPSWKDVMTYCSNEWVSDFTYEGIRSYLARWGCEPCPGAGQRHRFPGGGRHGRSVKPYRQPGKRLSDLPGQYDPAAGRRRLDDRPGWGGNADLATYPFAPNELTDSEAAPAYRR